MKKLLFMLTTVLAVAACGGSSQEKVPAIDITNMDVSVDPGENFYDYVTKGWRDKNPLKPEYSRFGRFDELSENNENRLNELFEEMKTKENEFGTVDQKISDLYKLGLDSTRLNAEGATPLKPYIDEVMSVTDKKSLAKVVAEMHHNGQSPFFMMFVMPDMKNSTVNVPYMRQGGLGLSNRDYYLDPVNAELKAGYRNFLAKVLALAQIPDAEKVADDAMEVEDAIAKTSWSNVENRNVEKTYNPTDWAGFSKSYPELNFETYAETLGIEPQEKIIVSQPSYFEGLNKILSKTPISKLRNYMLANLVSAACGSLSDDFTDAQFEFFSKQMAGVQEQKPRWKRAMSSPNRLLGEAVGQMYVEKYFPPKDKERMLELVKNIQDALSQHIAELDWMTDATKEKAQEKLSNFVVKIGYPDEWKDYSALVIDPELSYYQNLVNASRWFRDDNLSDLGKPVDKKRWRMTPQTVNASYNPTGNEICFPAGILQPPFYNPDADDAVNYGAIGVVIGHEMTHGFDDSGRHFDKDGNMVDWWAKEDDEEFRAKAARLVEQFNEVEVLPGVFAKGDLCLGENIADHGGLRIAYTAMQNSFNGKTPKPIDGFTPEQRFYLAYATVWAQNITDEEIARRTNMDVHSLGNNRVNVSIRNMDTFFDAFGIKEGDKMFRPEEDRVVIW